MIRIAEPGDLAAIVELEETCLGADAWSESLISEGIAGLPTVSYLVALDGDAIVAHTVVSAAGDVAELQRIAVSPRRRREGWATALLHEVVEFSRTNGADRVLLEVREDNTSALGFYAERGFVEIDRRARYYRDLATAVVMRRGIGPMCGGRP